MEKRLSGEHVPINFLSETYQVSFSIEPEAVPFLPEVTTDDMKTGKEKYGVLLGEEDITASGAHVHIRGILEMDREDGYYRENVNEISHIKLPAIQNAVTHIQKTHQEYAMYSFLGDIHTHPVTEKDLDGIKPWQPSRGDIDSIVEAYTTGQLRSDKPFVFGIAAPDESGKTVYSFYRLIRTKEGYSCKSI